MIDFVAGNGTASEQSNYQFDHERPVVGTNYYRLKQMDFDGKHEYSDIVLVEMERPNNNITMGIHPNPSYDGHLQITHRADSDDELTVGVFDVTGRVLLKKSYVVYSETGSYDLDLSAFGKGLFFVQMSQGGVNHTERVMVQ